MLYLAHDLNNPNVHRRAEMLLAGGARVTLAGFRRTGLKRATPEGVDLVELGLTEDAKLLRRAGSTFGVLLKGTARSLAAQADVVIARNLEMLILARHAVAGRDVRLVNECLDVHRLLLAGGLVGSAFRGLERSILKRVDRILVSSPAFIENYYGPTQGWSGPWTLVENKNFRTPPVTVIPPPPAPPWKIGWFGMIRCSKSLGLLTRLARAHPQLVQVVLAGRPSEDQFDDFSGQVAAVPNIDFIGPYVTADLPRLYGGVHFAWGLDYFEEGLNSVWLLPNRLYEGQLYGVPVIADRSVETGRWLDRTGTGVLLDDPERDLAGFFRDLTPERYDASRHAVAALPRRMLVTDDEECLALVRDISTPKIAEAGVA